MGVLGWSTDVDLIVIDLYLEARWKEGVEPNNEVRVSFKEVRHPTDHTWSIDATRYYKMGRVKQQW